jgi:YfiH family protein
MPIRSTSQLSFFQFESFDSLPVDHGIFTRAGGVSPHPWNTLNVGGTVGDELERVRLNQARALGALNRNPGSVFDVWQVHSADFVFTRSPRNGKPYTKADIILTDDPDVTLFMRFADCVPIMLVDPEKHAVAIGHAGWLGTVRGAAISAFSALQEFCGSRPEDIFAGIGPSIGPDHYEIGQEVLEAYQAEFPEQADDHFLRHDGKLYFDLWSANESQLRSVGIDRIEVASICTACDLDRWFSHRAEGGLTGRFGALLALKGHPEGHKTND